MKRCIPVTSEQVTELTFGGCERDAGEWDAFCSGWRHHAYHLDQHPAPSAKELGLYPDSQTLRISWERGWMVCQAAMRVARTPAHDLALLAPSAPLTLTTVECRCGAHPEVQQIGTSLFCVICECGRCTPYWPHPLHAIRCFVLREQTIVAEDRRWGAP